MLDINKIVLDTVNNMVESGVLEDQIKKSIECSIQEIIQENLKTYSDFGRELKSKVKDSLKVNFNELDLPTYNQLILEQVNSAVDLEVRQGGKENIANLIKEILQPSKDKYTLSELIEEFKNEISSDPQDFGLDDDEISEGHEISLFIERDDSYSSRFTHIYLDARSDVDYKHNCRYKINTSHDKPYSVRVEGGELKPICVADRLSKFERTLLNMYATGATLELDRGANEYKYDTEIEVDEEEEY